MANVRLSSTISLMAAFAILFSSSAFGQHQVFRAETSLVSVNVTVTDANAHHVPGLTADQFKVFEDGVPQEVEFFSAGEMPLDVAVLLDTSLSMTSQLPMVEQAATRLIRALRPDDRAVVLGISGGLRVLQPLTSDPNALIRAVENNKPSGNTPLFVSIYSTLSMLAKDAASRQGPPRRQALVVFSDGWNTRSGFDFTELLDVVRRYAIPIYAIAPRSYKSPRTEHQEALDRAEQSVNFELRKLATETGGRAFFPSDARQLASMYDDIAKELANQYSIGYQSTNTAEVNDYRQLTVQVHAKGVTSRARAGYIAAANGD